MAILVRTGIRARTTEQLDQILSAATPELAPEEMERLSGTPALSARI